MALETRQVTAKEAKQMALVHRTLVDAWSTEKQN